MTQKEGWGGMRCLRNVPTREELGKITYPKIAHILYVFLYSVTLLFSLSYKNRGLGFPKVVVYTMCIKTEKEQKVKSFFAHGLGQYLAFARLHGLTDLSGNAQSSCS